uniref:Ras-related protein Rab-7b n=1 Tax=Podarcis muralis TaxID=64176 RepID=A0A670I8R7_PODMU
MLCTLQTLVRVSQTLNPLANSCHVWTASFCLSPPTGVGAGRTEKREKKKTHARGICGGKGSCSELLPSFLQHPPRPKGVSSARSREEPRGVCTGSRPRSSAKKPGRAGGGRPAPFMNSTKRVDLKLIIIGTLGVGKTSLLHRYVHKKFYEDYRTTLGASILTKMVVVDSSPLKLQIWDTGGQERFRSMVSTFYKGSDGCMLAFDVTDMDSFQSLDDWREDFLQRVIPMEQGFPMVVLGNKIDLKDRQVSKEAALSWCKEKDIAYFEVSAKNDINVVQAFETLARQALSRVFSQVQCSSASPFQSV